ncbi:multiheme c-type cytochrome [Erythrobacter sp.]|uniref:LVIVD repeat-containing protein n=1 Tax=Erythrobacter sp. TaxID=1042 RepID=UPI003FA5E510
MNLRAAFLAFAALLLGVSMFQAETQAADKEKPVKRDYASVIAPPAPARQSQAMADAKSEGCLTCHRASDAPTMHETPAVVLGCTDCHGGNASIAGNPQLPYDHPDYVGARDAAHVLPKYPDSWHFPSSANPKRSYALLNKESPEFVKFVNPSDYRVAREACGSCHIQSIEAAERSIMATGAMLWGGATYNNGILPFKNYILGEAYTRSGDPAAVAGIGAVLSSPGELPDGGLSPLQEERGVLAQLYPLPTWHVIPPADVFRVFERGGRTINSQFPEIGLPSPTGQIQRLEEPGRPDLKQSNRGPGTGLRVAIPALNIHKTRLNDPFTWFMGTNDQPGDYRHSGCASCHVVYANDREPRHSLIYAQYGRDGQTVTVDPCINPQANTNAALQCYAQVSAGSHDAKHSRIPGVATGDYDKGLEGLPKSGLKNGGYDGDVEDGDYTGDLAAKGSGHGALKGPNDQAGGDMPKREKGHPLRHVFTRSIPTSQCMNCHMHQPNIFLNSYLGYTMWDYESDAPMMWPGPENTTPRPEGMSDEDYQAFYKEQRFPTAEQVRAILDRNPEAAAARGMWADIDFLRNVYELNPELEHTQFADYHGHGWNFRGIFKRDRDGNLLDAEGEILRPGNAETDSPEEFARHNDRWRQRWRKDGEELFVEVEKDPAKNGSNNPGTAVHMMSIHAEVGMQCVDCHFEQDTHGNGLIYGEVANAIEIGCKDCHGTADAYPTLRTSGPAAPPEGHNLALLRNPDGQRRFEWMENEEGRRVLIQRSLVDPDLTWEMSLVKDSVDPKAPVFNAKAARSKLMSRYGAESGNFEFGSGVEKADRAHNDDDMACFTCHLSWTTSCAGCHLPIEANWKTKSHRYEGDSTRNWASYNPQVARDQMFQLGKHQTTKGNQTAPVRSSSALVLSSTNINRERIYVQQPPISAIGFSSQAFAPHFPHTVRKTETKQCSDCHLSEAEDNNAIMAQLLLLGTNYVNFVGMHAFTGLEGGISAVRVTEYDEPQAVLGSYLHRYSYPEYWRRHVEDNDRELKNWVRGEAFDGDISGETKPFEEFVNVHEGTRDAVRCLQMRGEYLFVAEGKGGFRAYDIASIANKGISERIITAPFSPLGHDTHIETEDATCMALATNQPIAPERNTARTREVNQEQPFSPIYDYAFITDSEEGLIAVDVNTLADGEFRDNFFKRAIFPGGAKAWNPDGVLDGARHITLAGDYAYITANAGLVTVYLPKDVADDPATPYRDECELDPANRAESCLAPRVTKVVPLTDARATTVQFRYLWVTDADGVKLFDVTDLGNPVAVPEATYPVADAQRLYVARTYAYVAAKADGLLILDVENPRAPRLYDQVTLDGTLNDAEDVIVGSTNASLFAYIADGRNGMKVLQLTSPESQPNYYGFSPAPMPELVAYARTPSPALALSKGLDRDRAVDETGGQMAVFGRLGSRPFTREEMEKLFMTRSGVPWKVSDEVDMNRWVGSEIGPLRRNAGMDSEPHTDDLGG